MKGPLYNGNEAQVRCAKERVNMATPATDASAPLCGTERDHILELSSQTHRVLLDDEPSGVSSQLFSI